MPAVMKPYSKKELKIIIKLVTVVLLLDTYSNITCFSLGPRPEFRFMRSSSLGGASGYSSPLKNIFLYYYYSCIMLSE